MDANTTPLMKQYAQVKAKHPDALLLFRVGDFYETFGEDAIKAANALNIILTKRNNGGFDVELAGFPYHSLDLYLPRLVRAGYRVAICEQLEKPSPQKKIVQRGVTSVVTPGLTTDDKLLEAKSNNYLASIVKQKSIYGIAFLDITTGEFLVTEGDGAYLEKLIHSFSPSEIIHSRNQGNEIKAQFLDKYYFYPLEDWVFTYEFGRNKLLQQFDVITLKGYGIEEMSAAQIAAGAILHYLETTENKNLKHISTINQIVPDSYVWLDKFTVRNLELLHTVSDNGLSLLQVMDHTVCPMGSRLLRKWISLPLKNINAINNRLTIVSYLVENQILIEDIDKIIRQIGDLERLISKVPLGRVNPREVVQLKRTLSLIPEIKAILHSTAMAPLAKLADNMNACAVLKDKIEATLVDDPPVMVQKGGLIAEGVSEELDELRHIIHNSQQLLLKIQQEETEKTGISNLKIGFNNVFGYYLEVTNKHKHNENIPSSWVRKQTLSNGERYITDELKQLEAKILGAEDKIKQIEESIFAALIVDILEYIQPIQTNAHNIAQLDCLNGYAKLAITQHYCRPDIDETLDIDIKDGRHPVIEKRLSIDEQYVPNDTFLSNDDTQILMITGPNMAGKSAVLRQTALICLMAQMGSFVPAKEARIGLIDKVFTRVGATDNISSGESTFMVEMNETSNILNNISDRSIILLDEIGRGTSTYDGVSIAWSIAEYLHENPNCRPKTLFATHYHELNELASKFDRIKNFHIATKEINGKIIFLRKLKSGGSEHSFGIHVAQMAGMPNTVVKRAKEILELLESQRANMDESSTNISKETLKEIQKTSPYQLNIFEVADPVLSELKNKLDQLDINTMTPVECMFYLHEMKKALHHAMKQ